LQRFGGDALIVDDSASIPFNDCTFNTVSFVASLNHIPSRSEVVREAKRLLKPGGRVIITMLNPFWGVLRHKLAWWDDDQNVRGMKDGEKMGLTHDYLIKLMKSEGFELIERERFILWINNIYCFQKTC